MFIVVMQSNWSDLFSQNISLITFVMFADWIEKYKKMIEIDKAY